MNMTPKAGRRVVPLRARAECAIDIERVRAEVARIDPDAILRITPVAASANPEWVLDFGIPVAPGSEFCAGPDGNEVEIVACARGLMALETAYRRVPDTHMMHESTALATIYTGERVDAHEVSFLMSWMAVELENRERVAA